MSADFNGAVVENPATRSRSAAAFFFSFSTRARNSRLSAGDWAKLRVVKIRNIAKNRVYLRPAQNSSLQKRQKHSSRKGGTETQRKRQEKIPSLCVFAVNKLIVAADRIM